MGGGMDEVIANSVREMKEKIDADVSQYNCVEKIAAECKLDCRVFRHYFHVLFKEPPKEYIKKARLRRLDKLISETHNTVFHYSGYYSELLGFAQPQSFTRFVRDETGKSFQKYAHEVIHNNHR